MAAANLPALNRDGRVSVAFAAGVSQADRRRPPPLCLIALVPPDAVWFADRYPHLVVRDTRFRDRDFSVEHVRLSSQEGLDALPKLRDGSRVYDAACLALHSGVPSVHVLLVRVGGAKPWELNRPDLHQALDPFLGDMLGTLLVYPDIGGPFDVRKSPSLAKEEQVRRLIEMAQLNAARWVERYQVALLDAPRMGPELEETLFRSMVGGDVALCRFLPSDYWDGVHGWRSAAALLGGMLTANEDITTAMEDQKIRLPGGRRVSRGRMDALELSGPVFDPILRSDEYAQFQIRGGVATLRSEPVFRRPLGSWSIQALRFVKALHWRLTEAASRFVFDKLHPFQATLLAQALVGATKPFVSRGLLTGPDGVGIPEIRGGVDRNPAAPSLYADVSGLLQPWSQKVSVRVGIRPSGRPTLEIR